MKPSRRKRYRILTAAAELVSLWYGQKANEPFKKNDPAAERSYTHSSVIHDRDYFALWDACRRLGREFEFM
ncbi:hypothetical protein [Prosthecobacter sp.]|uniref:hypothetical protein n=1 Tax=Prosthecobacter sp. TaxID=1965333 RepID=UPI00378498B4